MFSEDDDVYIYIDGNLKGKNAGIKKDIQVGEHYIKAVKGKKDGPMIFSRVVEIKKGEIKTIVIPAGGQLVSTTTVTSMPSTTILSSLTTPELKVKAVAIPDLPFKVMDMDPMVTKEKNLKAGVYVIESSADAVQQGDIILSVNTIPLKDVAFYKQILTSLRVGEAVVLEVIKKDGEKRIVNIQAVDAGKEKLIVPSTKEAVTKTTTPESVIPLTVTKTEEGSPR